MIDAFCSPYVLIIFLVLFVGSFGMAFISMLTGSAPSRKK
jgi:hypothetical protein